MHCKEFSLVSMVTGLTSAQLEKLSASPSAVKVSQRDLAYCISQVRESERKQCGSTYEWSTMIGFQETPAAVPKQLRCWGLVGMDVSLSS